MVREQADSDDEGQAPVSGRRWTAVRLDAAALQSEAAKAPAAAPRASQPARGPGKFVIRDLDAEEIVPGLSKLSIKEPGAGSRDRGDEEEGPVASRTRAREREKGGAAGGARGTPAAKAAGRKPAEATSPSPTLSRYGVTLDYETPREQDVLAHGLHLSGFPPAAIEAREDGSQNPEREELVRPWKEVGALVSWLPGDQGAVAMFCSIPTAQRAARKVPSGPKGVSAMPLLSCPPETQQRALAAGLVIPPRPKADTAAAGRLIVGALGMRSPSSMRPPIGGSTPQSQRRTPITRSQAAKSSPGGGVEEGAEGTRDSRGDAAVGSKKKPPPTK